MNRRYDFGVNVKAAYALSLYAKLLHALGEEGGEAQIWGEEIRSSLQVMAVKGPFGPQISGGTNLGEQSDFYIKEDIPYYDGEDTASAMAGVYGILPYNNNLWENYRIFAQSLWLTNYEPETGGIRWYPWGGLSLIHIYNVMQGLRLSMDSSTSISWGPIMAMSFVAMLPCIVIFFLAQKYFVEGVATTGLKG